MLKGGVKAGTCSRGLARMQCAAAPPMAAVAVHTGSTRRGMRVGEPVAVGLSRDKAARSSFGSSLHLARVCWFVGCGRCADAPLCWVGSQDSSGNFDETGWHSTGVHRDSCSVCAVWGLQRRHNRSCPGLVCVPQVGGLSCCTSHTRLCCSRTQEQLWRCTNIVLLRPRFLFESSLSGSVTG